MSVRGLDPRFTFEQFAVAPASRLAAAAARRVADVPGKAYNPLFIYGASGLGKTHLLMAIGNQAARAHSGITIFCDTLERAIASGVLAEAVPDDDAPAGRTFLLLLDDAQTVAGDRRAQEALLTWWDALLARGTQIVITADRPPSEIDPIDHRLLSRLCSGLIADIGPPDYDMRVALVVRRSQERGHALGHGVAEAVARHAFANVRELQGALNRVMAAQELEGRPISAEEVAPLLGLVRERNESEEFASFFTEISGAVEQIATRVTPEQRLVDAIMRYEGEGFRTFRLEQGLRDTASEQATLDLVARFAAAVERLAHVAEKIRELDATAPELARTDLLRNPDRVLEAEALLAQVRDRLQPLPAPGAGPLLDRLPLADTSPALRAARSVARQPGSQANPLLIIGPPGSGRTTLISALARQMKAAQPLLPVACTDAASLTVEIDDALRSGSIETWRARYRRARCLVVDDIDACGGSAEARAELVGLFELIRGSGGQIVLTAQRPDAATGVIDALQMFLSSATVRSMVDESATEAADRDGGVPAETADPWFADHEKVLAHWPYIEDLLVLDWD